MVLRDGLHFAPPHLAVAGEDELAGLCPRRADPRRPRPAEPVPFARTDGRRTRTAVPRAAVPPAPNRTPHRRRNGRRRIFGHVGGDQRQVAAADELIATTNPATRPWPQVQPFGRVELFGPCTVELVGGPRLARECLGLVEGGNDGGPDSPAPPCSFGEVDRSLARSAASGLSCGGQSRTRPPKAKPPARRSSPATRPPAAGHRLRARSASARVPRSSGP